MLRLLVFLGVGWLIYAYLPGALRSLEDPSVVSSQERSDRIELRGVEMVTYTPAGRVRSKLMGDEASLHKTLKNAEVKPARVEVFDEGVLDTWITAAVGRKREGLEGGDRFEMEGNVIAESAGGRQLVGEVVHYYLEDERLLTPRRATVLTTRTRLSGDVLEMATRLNEGYARKNVEIVDWQRPADPDARPVKVTIQGEEGHFDLDEQEHRVERNVVVLRQEMRMRADRLEYYQGEGRAVALGRVDVRDRGVRIEGERLDYDLREELAVVLGTPDDRPHLVYTRKPQGDVQELWARTIRAGDRDGKRWLQGDEDVRFVVYSKTPRGLERDMTITSQDVDAFYAEGRATFTGDVKIVASTGGALGDRAVYYRDSGRVYLNGDAEAWEEDTSGRETRRISGEHIRYHVDTGDAVVLGGVSGYLPSGGG